MKGMADLSTERSAQLARDCLRARDALGSLGSYPTCQGILNDAAATLVAQAAELQRLRAHRAAARSEAALLMNWLRAWGQRDAQKEFER